MASGTPREWTGPLDAIPMRPVGPSAATGERIPTGVADFDHLTGGLPVGSVVLLVGEAGAGSQEFALTSAVHMMLHKEDPRTFAIFLGNAAGPFRFPEGIGYVSATRSREQVLREVAGAFEPTYHDVLARHLAFHDISPSYFSDSAVPSDWAAVPGSLLAEAPTIRSPDLLAAVADALEASGGQNLVVVDSLTDLLVRRGIDAEAILTLVKGLRRRAKAWGGLVYLLLARGVASEAVEKGLYDSVDGVLSFSWTRSATHSQRQRSMLIERFMPVLSRIPAELQGRFVIGLSALNGLVTTQYERI
jgi:KaiC/GvpD/RAD55 family RecA-like ATPase